MKKPVSLFAITLVAFLFVGVATAGAQKINATQKRGLTGEKPVLDSVALGLKKQMKTAADTTADKSGKNGQSKAPCEVKMKDGSCCAKKDAKCQAKDAKIK